MGFIASNTIAQGTTRESGLDQIIKNGGIIYNAIQSLIWPGTANVYVAIVHITKFKYVGNYYLEGKMVRRISSFLDDGEVNSKPELIRSNENIGFQGLIPLGDGFFVDLSVANELLGDGKSQEVLYKFYNGKIFYSSPDLDSNLWIINFGERDIKQAEKYPKCFSILYEQIYKNLTPKQLKDRPNWWRFWRSRPELQKATNKLDRVLVTAFTSSTFAFAFLPTNTVCSNALVIFAMDGYDDFSVMQSGLHYAWVIKYASTMKTDLRYTPTDCFQNFPFPKSQSNLIRIGSEYYHHRMNLMKESQEGLTNTYNRFHNPKEKSSDIAHMRELHVEMDNAVAAAYGWSDLDLGHGFHETPQGVRFTISEAARREVLARLLQLNHERYEEEVKAGLHEKDKKKAKEEQPARQKPKKLTQPKGQMNFLGEPEVADEAEVVEVLTPTPPSEIGSWDRCKCLVCGKTVMGFSIAEHTQSDHQGKDPGYRKMG